MVLERREFGTQCIKLGDMVLKGGNWVHNAIQLGHNGLERSQLCKQ